MVGVVIVKPTSIINVGLFAVLDTLGCNRTIMPISRRGNVLLNIGAVAGELIGTFMLTLIGVGIYAIPGITTTVIGVGLGFGFATVVLTYLFFIRSGAHFNTGVTFARALAWAPGLHERDYWGAGRLWWDLLFWFLYTGMQLAGAVLAILFLRAVDNSGFISAATFTSPNGNLAGNNGEALLLLWMCNTVLCWVALVLFSPRMGIQIKVLSNQYVMGFTVFGVVLVSVFWGTGSVCNFAVDLALATLIGGNATGTLWISAVAQILGAITAFVIFWAGAWLDRILDVRKHLTGNKHLDHSRVNALSNIINFMAVTTKEMALDSGDPKATDRMLVAETADGDNYPGYSHDDRRGGERCVPMTVMP